MASLRPVRACRDCDRLAAARAAGADLDDPRAATRWWHCPACGTHLERYRGQTDQACGCGQWFNAGGERLRNDWADNPAWRDDDISDIDGFELAQIAKEYRE